MNKLFLFTLSALFLFSLGACNDPNQESINKMKWLEGEWIKEEEGESAIEIWKFDSPSKLQGDGSILLNGDTVFSERMYIETLNSEIVYTAIPSGKKATEFKLVLQEDKRLEFENLEHDFPQRIIYWQENENTLNARITGLVNNSTKSFDFSWKKRSIE